MIVHTMHASLEFSDTESQHQHDVSKIFKRAATRGVAWVTGTEASVDSGLLSYMLREIGGDFGYYMWVPTEKYHTACWIAVKRGFAEHGSLRRGWIPVIPGGSANGASWGPRGLVTADFRHRALGEFNVAVSHYLVQRAERPDLNRKISEAASIWARGEGRGSALCFYSGDQNINDKYEDTFFDAPFTSLWDELGKHEDTGHGTYDVIASYDRDRRVKGEYIRALDDKEFFLYGDHFLVEGGFEVGRIRP
jgi:hypothetical protein